VCERGTRRKERANTLSVSTTKKRRSWDLDFQNSSFEPREERKEF